MSMTTLQRAWRGAKSEWRVHCLSALSSAVAFVCLAMALLMVVNLRAVQQRWEDVGRLSAYLAPATAESQAMRVVEALQGTTGVASVKYMSSAAARAEMIRYSPTQLLKSLPDEAFPPSIEVDLEVGHQSAPAAQVLAQRLLKLDPVDSVETYGSWGRRVTKFVFGSIAAAALLAAVVFFAVVTVVSSSIKLMLERRRDEVEVLRIIGATTDYVRRPFMWEGAIQGALGATGALLLSAILFGILRARLDDQLIASLGVAPQFLPPALCLGLVLIGASLGATASVLSLRRSSLV